MAKEVMSVEERERIRLEKEAQNPPKESVVKKMITENYIDLDLVVKPVKKERKSKAISFTMTPTLYDKIKKKSKSSGVSVSEAITQLLEHWTKDI